MNIIKSHRDLNVYQNAFQAALEIYSLSKRFPTEERYALTDQIRRSSRSVCANIAEAFRKRRYEKAFVAKLSDSETEAGETQVWLEFALAHHLMNKKDYDNLYKKYDQIISQIVTMMNQPAKWSF